MDEQSNKCCNPFNTPHRSFVSLIAVNADLANRARDLDKRIKATDMICTVCRKKLYNDLAQLSVAGTSKKDEPPAKRRLSETPENLQEMMDISTPFSTEEKSPGKKSSDEKSSSEEKSELSNALMGKLLSQN